MSVAAVIQAHMGSTRLPGKVFRKILGKPLLEHLINRLKASKKIDEIVVATTKSEKDDMIIKIAEYCGAKWFRGSEENVLDRILRAARKAGSTIVVRVTSDNPLTDPFSIDNMVEEHVKAGADYTWIEGMPIGTAAEVVSIAALERANELAKDPYDREHVTPFIKRHGEMFKIQILSPSRELFRPNYRLTVDYKEDLDLMQEIFSCLWQPGKMFTLNQVVNLLDTHPELLAINALH